MSCIKSIVFIALSIVLLVSCSSNPYTIYEPDPIYEADVIPEINASGNHHDTVTYSVHTYEQLLNAFSAEPSSENIVIQNEKALHGEIYQSFVDHLTNSATLKIPKINGSNFTLRGQEGYSNISVMTKELYNLPWIWYHCLYESKDVTIKTSYPRLYYNNITEHMNGSEIIRAISPTAPNIDNYTNYKNYKNVYLSNIALSDKTVSALVYEFADGDTTFSFGYGEILVFVTAKKAVLSEAFWKSFSLQ